MKNNKLHLTWGSETFQSKPNGFKEAFRATSLAGVKEALASRNHDHISSAVYIDGKGNKTDLDLRKKSK